VRLVEKGLKVFHLESLDILTAFLKPILSLFRIEFVSDSLLSFASTLKLIASLDAFMLNLKSFLYLLYLG